MRQREIALTAHFDQLPMYQMPFALDEYEVLLRDDNMNMPSKCSSNNQIDTPLSLLVYSSVC